MSPPPYPIIATTSRRKPRYTLLVLGGLVLAGAGVAAGLVLRPAGALPEATTTESSTPAGVPVTGGATPMPLITRSASVCATCGTVESVRAVPRSGAVDKPAQPQALFEVQVRMDDGSLRSFTSTTQPQRGAAVRVEGDSYRLVQRAADDAAGTARASG